MTTNQELTEQIEQLVRAHIDATRTAATAAVERAFVATVPVGGGGCVSTARPRQPRRRMAPRRAAEEVMALVEQFYTVVCRNPGETMATLAPQVGATPRALHLAVARLKRAGRVRAVGQRQLTRYFPMAKVSVAA